MELEPSREKQGLVMSQMESKLLLPQSPRGEWWLSETRGGVGILVTGS